MSDKLKYPKPKKQSFAKLQQTAQRLFNKYIVQSRGKRGCELHTMAKKANVQLPVKCNQQYCCFHIIPVGRSGALRFDERNVLRACTSANFWEHNNRDLWMNDFAPKILDRGRWLYLTTFQKMDVNRNSSMMQMMILEYTNKIKEK